MSHIIYIFGIGKKKVHTSSSLCFVYKKWAFMKVAYEYGGGKEVVGCFYKDKLLKIIKTHTH